VTSDIGIKNWKLTLLPLPKRFSRGTALGFCGGFPVGLAEAARGKVAATWWPDGKPELLELEGYPEVRASSARGHVIPGGWQKKQGEHRGAAAWTWRDNQLHGADLHDKRFDRTWARAAGGDLIVGSGVPPRVPGVRTRNVGLVWRQGQAPQVVADPQTEVALYCTNGVALAGSRDGRATLWPQAEAAPIDLTPLRCQLSEVLALDGHEQFGVAFHGDRARAARWAGSAESYADYTPEGFETAGIRATCQGFQAGSVRRRHATMNGTPGSDDQAALWRGGGDRWFDLNSLLPQPYNSSTALAVEWVGQEIRICGEVRLCEVSHPGTKNESHIVPKAHPALWTGCLA
jgi:hypothetical protein